MVGTYTPIAKQFDRSMSALHCHSFMLCVFQAAVNALLAKVTSVLEAMAVRQEQLDGMVYPITFTCFENPCEA